MTSVSIPTEENRWCKSTQFVCAKNIKIPDTIKLLNSRLNPQIYLPLATLFQALPGQISTHRVQTTIHRAPSKSLIDTFVKRIRKLNR